MRALYRKGRLELGHLNKSSPGRALPQETQALLVCATSCPLTGLKDTFLLAIPLQGAGQSGILASQCMCLQCFTNF